MKEASLFDEEKEWCQGDLPMLVQRNYRVVELAVRGKEPDSESQVFVGRSVRLCRKE